MPRTRPPYPPEYREQMVALHRAGRSCEELAREYEPSEQTIRNWVVQSERDQGSRTDGLTSEEKEELWRLRLLPPPAGASSCGSLPALTSTKAPLRWLSWTRSGQVLRQLTIPTTDSGYEQALAVGDSLGCKEWGLESAAPASTKVSGNPISRPSSGWAEHSQCPSPATQPRQPLQDLAGQAGGRVEPQMRIGGSGFPDLQDRWRLLLSALFHTPLFTGGSEERPIVGPGPIAADIEVVQTGDLLRRLCARTCFET